MRGSNRAVERRGNLAKRRALDAEPHRLHPPDGDPFALTGTVARSFAGRLAGARASAAGPRCFCIARLRARRARVFLSARFHARFHAAGVFFFAIVARRRCRRRRLSLRQASSTSSTRASCHPVVASFWRLPHRIRSVRRRDVSIVSALALAVRRGATLSRSPARPGGSPPTRRSRRGVVLTAGLSVDGDGKVRGLQIPDRIAVAINDGDIDLDEVDTAPKGRALLRRLRRERRAHGDDEQASETGAGAEGHRLHRTTRKAVQMWCVSADPSDGRAPEISIT